MSTESQPSRPLYYFWFDMEFTDLDPSRAHILQVAALITDVHLQRVRPNDVGLNLCVRLEPDAYVSDWVRENLSALVARCQSDDALPVSEVGARLIQYVDDVAGPPAKEIKERPAMAGNSVHSDWRLACIHFPTLQPRLSYRLLDVSTIKQQWHGWLGQPEFDKENATLIQEYLPFDCGDIAGQPHDAHYDILASIAELNFYRTKLRWMSDGIKGDQQCSVEASR